MPILKKLPSHWLIALQGLLIVLSFLPLCLMERAAAAEPQSAPPAAAERAAPPDWQSAVPIP